jgi:hypothetical protein
VPQATAAPDKGPIVPIFKVFFSVWVGAVPWQQTAHESKNTTTKQNASKDFFITFLLIFPD